MAPFQWPWTTANPDCNHAIIWRWIKPISETVRDTHIVTMKYKQEPNVWISLKHNLRITVKTMIPLQVNSSQGYSYSSRNPAIFHKSASGVARNLIFFLGVYVLTSHCNFKTCVNVPHVNKTVTDFGGIYTDIPPVAMPLKSAYITDKNNNEIQHDAICTSDKGVSTAHWLSE